MADRSPIPHPGDWPAVHLGEITTKIGSGATPTGGEDSYLPERMRFALIRSQNVFDRHFDSTGLAFISDEQASRLQGVVLQPGDLLLNITGDGITFSRVCAVPVDVLPACVNQHVAIVRVNGAVADPGYVLSYLTHPAVKSYIESFNAGGSRRAITKGHIESFEIALPPLAEQRAIAHILGTLDDKIELNRQMNETLEAMARTIFKSWFVDFDPVCAKAEGCQPARMDVETAALFPDAFEDSTLGKRPKGWYVGPLGGILELKRGYDLPQQRRIFGFIPIYSSSGLTGYHSEAKVKGPGIVTGRYGTIGEIFFVNEDFWPLNTTLYVRNFKNNLPRFVYYLLHTLSFEAYLDKAAVPGINRNHVHQEIVLCPPVNLQYKFVECFEPFWQRQTMNNEEARTLTTIRDTLLPQLISGELRVRDAERFIGRIV
jgi:type I restriction enzyme S subunit